MRFPDADTPLTEEAAKEWYDHLMAIEDDAQLWATLTPLFLNKLTAGENSVQLILASRAADPGCTDNGPLLRRLVAYRIAERTKADGN